MQIDFLPEERAFSKIIQQIKLGHIAYPLFGLARMFLERPERHRIRVRSLDNHTMIYQFGDDGPVSMDPAALERNAFNEKREEYYGTADRRKRADQRQFFVRRPLHPVRQAPRAHQLSRFSTGPARTLRSKIQPADEF